MCSAGPIRATSPDRKTFFHKHLLGETNDHEEGSCIHPWRRAFTASLSVASTPSESSQPRQASVMLWP